MRGSARSVRAKPARFASDDSAGDDEFDRDSSDDDFLTGVRRDGGSGGGRGRGRGRGRGGGRSGPKLSGGDDTGRVRMLCPVRLGGGGARRAGKNQNKHKRLFDGSEGGLVHGQRLAYRADGQVLLEGTAEVVKGGECGIRCLCPACGGVRVISCSAFEAHAGETSQGGGAGREEGR
jgi:hypothetical protein